MTPLIMLGQWWSDKRHGRKQYRQQIKQYRERMKAFEASVDRARADDEAARRTAAPDPAEVLLTATGPRRRLWERRDHDPDALRLRVGLADLPRRPGVRPRTRTAPDETPCPTLPPATRCPCAGHAPAGRRRRDRAPGDDALGWPAGWSARPPPCTARVTWRSSCSPPTATARSGGAGSAGSALRPGARGGRADCVALVGADPEAAARRVSELATLIEERLDEDDGRAMKGSAGSHPAGATSAAAEQPLAAPVYDERPFDVLVVLDGAQVLRALPGMPQVLRQGPPAGRLHPAVDGDQRLLPEECRRWSSCAADGTVRSARRRPGRRRRDPGRPGVGLLGRAGGPGAGPAPRRQPRGRRPGPARVGAAARPAGPGPRPPGDLRRWRAGGRDHQRGDRRRRRRAVRGRPAPRTARTR